MSELPRSIELHRARIESLKSNPRYYYDHAAAEQVARWIELNLVLTGDWNGQPFRLMDWQKQDIIYPLFGIKHRDTGLRLFKEAYIQLPRGNGKTYLAGAIMLYYLLLGGKGITLYCVGSNRATARLAFQDAVDLYLSSPRLKKYFRLRGDKNVIEIFTTTNPRNRLIAISADVRFDGPRPAMVSLDEYHQAASSQLYTVFKQGITKLREGLLFTITNAGSDMNSPCRIEYEKASKVLTGELQDDTYLAYVPEPDENEAWDDIETARKVNLSLGHVVQLADLERELADAKAIPAKKPAYIRYRLNRWFQDSLTTWIPGAVWQACKVDYTEESLAGQECYIGLDLSQVRDLTAIGFVFPRPDNKVRVLAHYFIPAANIQAKELEDGVPYRYWADRGILTLTPKATIDTDSIVKYIEEMAKRYRIKSISYDPYHAIETVETLRRKGYDLLEFPQRCDRFHPVVCEIEGLILDRQFEHNADPCTAWCISNTHIYTDGGGRKKPVKEHRASTKRIDGTVAILMALDPWLREKISLVGTGPLIMPHGSMRSGMGL